MTQKLAVPLAIDAPSAEGPVKVVIQGTGAGRPHGRSNRRRSTVELKAVRPKPTRRALSSARSTGASSTSGWLRGIAEGTGLPPDAKPALVLTLHGAGVEAIGQARAYKPKDWAYIVAATNRRPYGFDWEDWGRLDALEVLAEAARLFATDPARTYLTGHSMGGHGAWQVGATVPGPLGGHRAERRLAQLHVLRRGRGL